MGRKKKVTTSNDVGPVVAKGSTFPDKEVVLHSGVATVEEKKPIEVLSVDYPSEGLNNMAKKINEIIEEING